MNMETPEEYMERSSHTMGISQHILEMIFKRVAWNENECPEILDVGCGPGNVTKEVLVPLLPQNFKKLIGVDNREDFITYAKNNYSDDKVEFVKMDVVEGVPPEYEGRFDMVTSLQCYHQLHDQDIGFENPNKCIKPGGHLILIFKFHKFLDDFIYQLSKDSKWEYYINPPGRKRLFVPNFDDLEDLKTLFLEDLQKKGFNIVYEELKHVVTLVNRQKYIESIKSSDQFARGMPDEQREEYFKLLEDNYVNKGLTEEQVKSTVAFLAKHTLIIVHATKV